MQADMQDEEYYLAKFGLAPGENDLGAIREMLRERIKLESANHSGDTEVMKLFCVQLFNAGNPEDSLLVFAAKSASMDAGGSIDIQLTCGAGLEPTKEYLRSVEGDLAAAALHYIESCEAADNFLEFTPSSWSAEYERYYGCDASSS